MARKNRETRSLRAPKKTIIPKDYLASKAEAVTSELQELLDGRRNISFEGTRNMLQGVIDTIKHETEEVLNVIPPEGIQFKEDHEQFCADIGEIVKNGRMTIDTWRKQGDKDGHDVRAMKTAINQLLSKSRSEISDRFDLPSKAGLEDGIETKDELLNFVSEKILAIFAQNGLNSMIDIVNRKSIEHHGHGYFVMIKILYPFVHALFEIYAETIGNLNVMVADGSMKPKEWDSRPVISLLERGFSLNIRVSRLEMPIQYEDYPELVNLHKRLKDNFSKIQRSLGGLQTKRKFKKLELKEEDQLAKSILGSPSHQNPEIKMYVQLRDKNIAKHGKYTSIITYEDLNKKEQGQLESLLTDYKDSKTELYEIPDDEALQIICDDINSLPILKCKYLLPEDIKKMIGTYNANVRKELENAKLEEKELLKTLFKNKLFKHIETVVLKVIRITRPNIADTKNVSAGQFIPVSKEEFEAIKEFFEDFKRQLLGQIDLLVDKHFEKHDDDWQGEDLEALEEALRKPLLDGCDDFCKRLQGLNIDPKKEFLKDNILGISVDFREIVDDVNNEVELDPVKSEPDILNLVSKGLLYSQGPKDQQNEKWLIEREISEAELEVINSFLDIIVEPELLKVTEVDEYLNDLEVKGLLEEAANSINNQWYGGLQVRNAKQIRDIAFEFLTKKKREIREVKKAKIELPKELQERLDKSLEWVESLGWPFSEKPAELKISIPSTVKIIDAKNRNISSYIKIPWAHYIHLIHRDNMPVDIVIKHIENIEAYRESKKPPTQAQPDGQFSVKYYESQPDRRGQKRNSLTFWLETTEHPFRKEDQRSSVSVDRLDAHISILQRRKEDLQVRLHEMEEIQIRKSKLERDVLDLTNELIDCDKAYGEIEQSIKEIRDRMQEMLAQAGTDMSEILSQGEEATKKEQKLEPILRKKVRAQESILAKQDEINELDVLLDEMPGIQKEIEDIAQKLKNVEEIISKAFEEAKI